MPAHMTLGIVIRILGAAFNAEPAKNCRNTSQNRIPLFHENPPSIPER